MDCSEVITGGKKVLGGQVLSSLANIPHFMSMEELEAFIGTHGFEAPAPFSALDLSTPASMADHMGLPPVTVKSLAQLLREFQVQSSNGKAAWNHGTREFAKARTKVETHIDERTKAKVKKQIWVASPTELKFHESQIMSMNLALALYAQETQGIDSDQLFTRFRFFKASEIQHVISDCPQKHFLWRFGQAFPDRDHLALIIRHETTKGFSYAGFSLVIP